MLGIHEIWLFILSGLLLNITPGPDSVYVIGRSMQMGWRGGAAAALGISCGCFVHVAAAAIGLSALLMASSTAFSILKLVGAAYLVVTGLQMLWSRPALAQVIDEPVRSSLRRVFLQGVFTNALNPKVALFFLAILPQFVGTGADAPLKGALLIAVPYVLGGFWLTGIVFVAARAGRAAKKSSAMRWIEGVLGVAFVGLAGRLALARNS